MKQRIYLLLIFVFGLNLHSVSAQIKAPSEKEGVSHAGKAKPPRGKMTFLMDGKSITSSETQVQSMMVGLGPEMAQAVITGGNKDVKINIVFIGKPELGEATPKKGSVVNIGISVIKGGTSYSNMSGGATSLSITKITKDRNNFYIAGTFSCELKDSKGVTIKITEGKFESAYL